MKEQKLKLKLKNEEAKIENLKKRLKQSKIKIKKIKTAIQNEELNKIRYVVKENNYTLAEAVEILEGKKVNDERKPID